MYRYWQFCFTVRAGGVLAACWRRADGVLTATMMANGFFPSAFFMPQVQSPFNIQNQMERTLLAGYEEKEGKVKKGGCCWLVLGLVFGARVGMP